MSFLVEVVAGLVASALSAMAGHFFSASRRPRLPKFLGGIALTEARTTAAGILGITLSAGIGLSTSDHSHRMLSYILWYGLALAALTAVIVCTVLDRRRSRSESNKPIVPQQSPSLPMSHRQAGILATPKSSTSAMRRTAAANAIKAGAQEREERDRLKAEIKEELAEDSGATPAEREEEAPQMPAALADKLGRLYQEGRKIRQLVKPDNPNPLLALSLGLMFKYPNAPFALETEARQWNEKTRNQITLHAPRFSPDWERCPELPSREFLPIPITADGRKLVTFLDARLGLLENIICEVRASTRAAAEPAA